MKSQIDLSRKDKNGNYKQKDIPRDKSMNPLA